MNNRAEVNQYLDDGIRQCTKAKNKFILAPYFEEYAFALISLLSYISVDYNDIL